MPERKTGGARRWVAKVQTDCTHPPPGLFTKSAATIARTLASKKVSPKGPGSGMRMLSYFINRRKKADFRTPGGTGKGQDFALKPDAQWEEI